MEEKEARLLIQLFADEESETTDLEDVETEIEYTDGVNEETEETSNEVEKADSESEETTEEPEKVIKSLKELLAEDESYQDEMNDIVKDRLKREKNRLDRDYREKLSKYEELAYLTQAGLKANDFDETLDKSREFYGKQGIKYTPTPSTEDEEILANAYTNRIIENCDTVEDLEAEADRLLRKGVNISGREKLVLQGLISEMESRKRISDLAKLGVKEEVYNSKEFTDFEKKFDKKTPIAEIYELYRSKTKAQKSIDNPGSMKSTPSKEKKTFITEAEYDRMTDKEIEENMELIKASMPKW